MAQGNRPDYTLLGARSLQRQAGDVHHPVRRSNPQPCSREPCRNFVCRRGLRWNHVRNIHLTPDARRAGTRRERRFLTLEPTFRPQQHRLVVAGSHRSRGTGVDMYEQGRHASGGPAELHPCIVRGRTKTNLSLSFSSSSVFACLGQDYSECVKTPSSLCGPRFHTGPQRRECEV